MRSLERLCVGLATADRKRSQAQEQPSERTLEQLHLRHVADVCGARRFRRRTRRGSSCGWERRSPAAIPGQFVPLPGLEPLVAIERADALQRREQAATSALDAAVHALGDGVAVAVEQQVLFGSDPAATILEIAGADVDLLVLGSRAYGPMRRALVGSVSSAIVRHAPRPVLVTPRVGDGAG